MNMQSINLSQFVFDLSMQSKKEEKYFQNKYMIIC